MTVSVITPLYNGEKSIERCINSVLSQTSPVLEHIIIDNNSKDNGPEIVRQMAARHPHIRLLSCETKGAGPTRNTGIEAAEGRFIAFLDCDDAWTNNKTEEQIAFMCENRLAFSWTGFDIFEPDGSFKRYQNVARKANWTALLNKQTVIGCLTAVYDRELLGRKFLMNHLPLRQDFCLFLDIVAAAEQLGLDVGGLDRPLANYHLSPDSISASKFGAAKAQWRAYREHFGLGRISSARCFFNYAFRAFRVRLLKKASV